MLYILAWIWMFPTMFVGGIWTLIACKPVSAEWVDGVLEVTVKWLPMNAIGETWGQMILYREGQDKDSVRKHERVHVKQNWIFGPTFMLVYGVASLVARIKYGEWYRMNAFEQWARNESGQS